MSTGFRIADTFTPGLAKIIILRGVCLGADGSRGPRCMRDSLHEPSEGAPQRPGVEVSGRANATQYRLRSPVPCPPGNSSPVEIYKASACAIMRSRFLLSISLPAAETARTSNRHVPSEFCSRETE